MYFNGLIIVEVATQEVIRHLLTSIYRYLSIYPIVSQNANRQRYC